MGCSEAFERTRLEKGNACLLVCFMKSRVGILDLLPFEFLGVNQ